MPVLGNEGYTTVGNPTLGVTSILTKLRWDGGMIRVIVIRAMLVIQAMLLIQVCYYRLRAMILQATTDHYTTVTQSNTACQDIPSIRLCAES